MHSQSRPSHTISSHNISSQSHSSQSNRDACLEGDSQTDSLLSHGSASKAARSRRLSRLRWNLSAVMMSIAAVGAAIAPAWANPVLTKWTFEPDNNFLEIILTEEIKPRYYLMARPARVVLDLPGTTLGTGKIRGDYPGAVRQVQVSQPEPELTRIVLELAPDAILAPEQVAFRLLEGNVVPNRFRWALQPLIAGRLLPTVEPGAGITPVPVVSPSSAIPPSSALPTVPPTSALPTAKAVATHVSPVPVPSSAPIAPSVPVSVPIPTVQVSKKSSLSIPLAPPQSTAQTVIEKVDKVAEKPVETVSVKPSAVLRLAPASPDAVPVAPPKVPPIAVPPLSATSSIASSSPSRSLATVPQVSSAVSSQPVATSPAALSTPPPPDSPPLPQPRAVSSTSTVPANVPVANVVPPPVEPVAIVETNLTGSAPQVKVPSLSPLTAPTITATSPSRPETPPSVPVESVNAPSAPISPVIQVATATITAAPSALAFETAATDAVGESPAAPASASLSAQAKAEQPAVTVPPLAPRPMPQADSLPTSPAVNSPASSQPAAIAATQRPAELSTSTVPVIEFGQPLPWGTTQPSSVLVRPSGSPSDVLLPSGTLLNLRYPGPEVLNLRATPNHQEVLLLQTEVRDEHGQVVIPIDSRVMGRFETNRAGSRFVAHAIALPGRTLQLQAESEVMTGERAVQSTQLAINSGLGAVAGGVLGKGSGAAAVGGAAAGAAVSYFTAPKPASIVPGQLLQVRLLENLR